MPEPVDNCGSQSLSPLRMMVDLYVWPALFSLVFMSNHNGPRPICLLVAGSFIPQVTRIVDRNSNDGISRWHILLATVSVNAHLAARIGGASTKISHDCIRRGHLQGWKAFSAFIMVLQILVHWVAAITLLAVYVSSRQHHSDQHGNSEYLAVPTSDPDIHNDQSGSDPVDIHSQGQRILALASGHSSRSYDVSAASTAPSTTAFLAVVITHAAVVFPPAFYILFNKLTFVETYGFAFFQQGFYIILSFTGLVTSFASIVVQAYLMHSRYHLGLGLGSFSIQSSGLQILAFGALSVSQSVRLWFWTPGGGLFWGLLVWFLNTGGPAVSYCVSMLGQVVLFCVALWVDSKRREDMSIV